MFPVLSTNIFLGFSMQVQCEVVYSFVTFLTPALFFYNLYVQEICDLTSYIPACYMNMFFQCSSPLCKFFSFATPLVESLLKLQIFELIYMCIFYRVCPTIHWISHMGDISLRWKSIGCVVSIETSVHTSVVGLISYSISSS